MEKNCPNCNSPMVFKKAGISKNGKPYPAFWSCTNKDLCGLTENATVQNIIPPSTIPSMAIPQTSHPPLPRGIPSSASPTTEKDLVIAREATLNTAATIIAAKLTGFDSEDKGLPVHDLITLAMQESQRMVRYVYSGEIPDGPKSD